ncbi:MAG: FtsX-like permease family protein [Vicinamibacterales bacterium]
MTMRERRRFVAWEHRFMVQMMTAFALVALALAAFGVYALLAYAVRQRFAEIGVRLALGAHPRDVERMFLAQGLAVTGGGAAAGLVLAALVAGALDGLFFGVEAWSPGHFVLAAGVLAATALVASYVPARRAARTDPSTALRAD